MSSTNKYLTVRDFCSCSRKLVEYYSQLSIVEIYELVAEKLLV